MKRIIYLALFLLCSIYASAQEVSNVTVRQEGDKIVVGYDLSEKADIILKYSEDGGRNSVRLYEVTGDVGSGVKKGYNEIVWDVLSEVDELVGSNIVFEVVASNHFNAAGDFINFGIGYDYLVNLSQEGYSIPIDIKLGYINQPMNVSVGVAFSELTSSTNYNLVTSQFGIYSALHYNTFKNDLLWLPVSFGLGYNFNKISHFSGYSDDLFDDDDEFYPLINSGNLYSSISMGLGTSAWLFSIYYRFDWTPTFNMSNLRDDYDDDSSLFDTDVTNIIDDLDHLGYLGLSFKVYF